MPAGRRWAYIEGKSLCALEGHPSLFGETVRPAKRALNRALNRELWRRIYTVEQNTAEAADICK